MCDLRSKFEKDQTKSTVAIMHERTVLQTHTDRQTDRYSSDFISVQCHALHWTDKNRQIEYVITRRPTAGGLMNRL